MHDDIQHDFKALSARAKITVFARTISMETTLNRDHPESAERLYQSSEFVHRLSGYILSLTYRPDDVEREMTRAAKVLTEGMAIHGQPYLRMLHEWIMEAGPID
jgi:hypothetical protein